MADAPKPNKFRCSQLSWSARGECIVNDETGERIIDAGLDIYDGNESAVGVEKFARWLAKAAKWAKAGRKQPAKSGFTIIELLVAFAILLFLSSLLIPAVVFSSGTRGSPETGWLRTVEHDGHLFVMSPSFRSSDFFLHHPGCSCRHATPEAGK